MDQNIPSSKIPNLKYNWTRSIVAGYTES